MLPQLSLASSVSDLTPVSHWTCDEEGGVRYDSVTATANDLTDNNTVGYVSGLLGNACDFELSDSEYLSKASNTTFPTGASARSISVWYKLESIPSETYSPFVSYGEQSVCNDEFSYVILNSGGTKYGVDNFCAGDFTSDLSLTTATWYHAVVSYDGSQFTFYHNGSSVGTGSQVLATGSDDNFKIGRRWTSSYYFDGLMDEISIFDYALDSTQVTTLYNSGAPLPYSGGSSSSTPTSTPTSTDLVSNSSSVETVLFHFYVVFLITFFGFIFYFKQNNQS